MINDKAIYGMAQPFDDFYFKDDIKNGVFLAQRTNKSAVHFDSKVGMTLRHDYSQQLGTTDENLFLQVTDTGIFFKLIPNTAMGWSAYKKVKRAALRHCSLSYVLFAKERNIEFEKSVTTVFRSQGYTDQIVIEDYKNIMVFEVCLTNGPANKSTFCTTNKYDPRLDGLNWENIAPIPEALCQADDPTVLEYKEWMNKETKSLEKLFSEYQKSIMGGYVK